MRILGAILAGGQARRFGSNKALARLHGEPLIAHAARALRELRALENAPPVRRPNRHDPC